MQSQKSSSRISGRAIFVVSVIVGVVFVFNTAMPARAAVGINKTINFQGKLVGSNGLNVADGNYTVVFTLYDDPSAGSNLWDETQTVAVADGIFQVSLGSVDTTLGNVNFNSDQLYLGIKVGADAEMTPRIRFTAVPYAFNSTKVNGLTVTNTSGNPFSSATTFQIADGKTVVINNGLTLAGTDSTTITFQGTDTYVGRATTDTLTNKTIGSTGLTFSGAGTDITSASNEDLTFTPNGSGDLILASDFNSGILIGSAGNTLAPLSISGGIGSNASLIVNQTNAGDLFTASQSGTTKFQILNNGNVRITSLNAASCDVKADTSGLLSCGTDATGPGGSETNYLELDNGAFSFINDTADFILGGTSTSSAKFAFMNMNSNSGLDPIASFAGTLRLGSKPNSTVAQQTTWTKVSQSSPGTIAEDGGSTTNIASISASVSYNGSIYVGTYKDNSAEIYRFDNSGANWTRVSAGAGQITSGGTSSIASVSAMTVLDGRLYAGTSKIGQAEVYRYEGGTTWTKVSMPTAGSFTATVTGQDGVASMGVYQGRLYAGTREAAVSNATGIGAWLLRYEGGSTWTAMNSAAGTFVTTNTVGVHAVTAITPYAGALYVGLSKAGDADIVKWNGTAASAAFIGVNATGTTGSYTINGTAVTGFDEVSSMLIYNGNLVASLRKNNAAEVVMTNQVVGETANANTFTRLNNAAGQMTAGGTANIDRVAAMTLYNGLLYIGTQEGNSAEIYRYTGDEQKFFKVSQAAAGTIASGGTASIDGVVNLIPSNGDLFAGTMELGRAEVYRHTSSIDRSYGLEFQAKPQIAGGEQSGLNNHASIFYLASASANLGSSNGNTGAFIFSHGIQTRNGSYDVAEDYATRDDTLEPGDLVSIDSNERGFVKKSEEAYEAGVIGVYSENPALRLSQIDSQIDGARAVPVALAGRVPVKVTTENGSIQAGDYLTASSQPGVAMKATKAGGIIGQAMGGFSCDSVSDVDQTLCNGKVTMYVKSSSYAGSIASTFAGFEVASESVGKDILIALAAQKPQHQTSEVVTDTLVAGLRIVSPEVTTQVLGVTAIEAVGGKDIDLLLDDEGTFSIKYASGEAGMVFTGKGDAYFAGQVQTEGLLVNGTITADKLKVNEIILSPEAWEQAIVEGGLASMEAQIFSQELRIAQLESRLASTSAIVSPAPSATESALTSLLANLPDETVEQPVGRFSFANLPEVDTATISGKLIVDRMQVTGSAIVEGLLHVVESLTARTLIVDDLATFLGKVVFNGDVFFQGRPTFNNDTAGIAMVKKGSDRVEVVFDKPYETAPMITANLTLDEITPMPSEALESLTKRQEQLEDEVFDANVRFIVTQRTTKGFVILLDKPAKEDLTFSWIAVTVDKPVVHEGNGDNSKIISTQIKEKVRPISSILPTITPTYSMEREEIENLPSPEEVDPLTPPGYSEARKEVSERDVN